MEGELEATGAVWAAILASGIGGFAMGFVVLLNEAGIFTAPTLYAPAGGVSGRTTLAVVVWLLAWVLLHRRWRGRNPTPGPVLGATVALAALGVLGCIPTVWGLF